MSLIRRIPDHTHPWLHALREGELEISAFWDRVADAGTPLIEADPNSPDHSLVTFLWRGREHDRWVAMSYEGANFAPHLLAREGRTDVWHATYRCRNDLRTPYHFAPNVRSRRHAVCSAYAPLSRKARNALGLKETRNG